MILPVFGFWTCQKGHNLHVGPFGQDKLIKLRFIDFHLDLLLANPQNWLICKVHSYKKWNIIWTLRSARESETIVDITILLDKKQFFYRSSQNTIRIVSTYNTIHCRRKHSSMLPTTALEPRSKCGDQHCAPLLRRSSLQTRRARAFGKISSRTVGRPVPRASPETTQRKFFGMQKIIVTTRESRWKRGLAICLAVLTLHPNRNGRILYEIFLRRFACGCRVVKTHDAFINGCFKVFSGRIAWRLFRINPMRFHFACK